jgi:lipoyl synthase
MTESVADRNSGNISATSPHRRMPDWLKRPIAYTGSNGIVEREISVRRLHTVCTEARCPNRGECYSHGTATFLVMGDVCTRNCGFCNVKHGNPVPLDEDEPRRLCETVRNLGIRHVVITSVTRDDLADGGAGHFSRTVKLIKDNMPECSVEVLVPDFGGNPESVDNVIESRPDVFNHNVETVQRLYPSVRPGASYERSLGIIARASDMGNGIAVKSGVMAGLGETFEEMISVFYDLYKAGCRILTVGQYLRPSNENLSVTEFVNPDIFRLYREKAISIGFSYVASGPYVRSSYKAVEALNSVRV